VQAGHDDCEHRINYREHEGRSILTKREQESAMIASTVPDDCKRLQVPTHDGQAAISGNAIELAITFRCSKIDR